MSLFSRSTVDKTKINNLVKKTKQVEKKKPTVKKGTSIADKIKTTCSFVQNKLGHLQDELELINTEEGLHDYISYAIDYGSIAIDTETTGLDPITDEIVGACIYTPGRKAAYIPINHISAITRQRVANQLTNEQVANEFKRLIEAKTKVIYFNAKFDIRVMRHQLGVDIPAYWDGFIAGKCLKENEEEGNLKYLWKKYCSPDKDAEHFTFEKLFAGIQFNLIPLNTAYLYAAFDAKMTYDLYEFQEPWLDPENEKCKMAEMEQLSKLFKEIEMPIISIVADIEDTGVALDVDFCYELSKKYNAILNKNIQEFNEALDPYRDQILAWVNTHPQTKLENPINIGSSDQLAELFYDILKQPVISRKKPRGTGEDILQKMNHPLCKPILDYRGTTKLLTTYIDKMPNTLNKKTHRIHATFAQYGADSGRFSSKDPNLQNIPSHNKEIRRMFKATTEEYVSFINGKLELLKEDVVPTLLGEKKTQDLTNEDVLIGENKTNYHIKEIIPDEDGVKFYLELDVEYSDKILVERQYVMVGADYSQQEPKITADLSNDEKFIADCAAGKDAYGTVASLAYNKPYEECLEFYLDENGKKTDRINKEGKERRTESKSILLGITYGRTVQTIAEQLKCSVEKAQGIYDSVLRGLPGLHNLIVESEEMARTKGYVTTKWGRRRHIPDMQLEPYVVKSVGTKSFDPFFDSEELGVVDETELAKRKIIEELNNAKYHKQKQNIILKAKENGFEVKDNTFFIEEAKRQCVNSRIQGSAADQAKIAMRLIGNNKQLKNNYFRMIILVHDEIIAEVPIVYAKKSIPLFTQCMLDAAKDLRTGAACDATIVKKWYDDQFGLDIKYEDLPD